MARAQHRDVWLSSGPDGFSEARPLLLTARRRSRPPSDHTSRSCPAEPGQTTDAPEPRPVPMNPPNTHRTYETRSEHRVRYRIRHRLDNQESRRLLLRQRRRLAVGRRRRQPLGRAGDLLLTDELAEVSEHARAAAQQLADRIGDLGGAITADPGHPLDARPGDSDFELPDCGDVRSITEAGLRELNVIITAYEKFLVKVRDTDPGSHQLVTRLLGDETHRRADIEAALKRP